jgi:superfamily II DNA or RNA helicase
MEARAHRLVNSQGRPEPGDYERNWPFKMQPRDYQLRIFAPARRMKYFALAPVVMGAGKTKMLLDVAADKFMRDEIDGVMVIASPKLVHKQWVTEAVPQHMTDAVKWRAAAWSPTRKTPIEVAKAERQKRLRILTFNVDAFSTESGKAFKAATEFLKSGRIFLIEDESSRIKNPKADRTKAILKLRDMAACRAISTGTPLTRGLEDLWAQYEFLDPNILGMSNFFAFRGRYCITAPAYRGAGLGVVKIVGYRNMEEFVRKIAPATFVVPKEALGLPPKRYEILNVELTPEQAKIYNMLRKKLIEDLEEHRIASPVNGAVRIMHLQQVLCGRVYREPESEDVKGVYEPIPSNRIKALLEFLGDNPGPTVIWCRFKADILGIAGALRDDKKSCVTFYGDTSDADRDEAKALFRSGKAEYFIGNPASAGMGLDGLQDVCDQAVYYSNSFNREHRWQSEDRINRIGMTGTSSLYVDMRVSKSVDQMILDSFQKTGDLVRDVMSRPELIPVIGEE